VFDLKAKLEKVVEGKVGLRAVCDCILRSSGANPSKFILLPTLPMPKVHMCFEIFFYGYELYL
jgi:hypothetical protein